jgi:1,4-alpha-glucan branching enzyme
VISQANIDVQTPMGANLIAGGATFRVWAPAATAVYLNGTFNGQSAWTSDCDPELLLLRDARGYWTGFVAGATTGDQYKFYVAGTGSSGYKRDPFARELTANPAFPLCNCVLRPNGANFAWSDAGFRTPSFSDMVLYQLHVGTYNPRPGKVGTFLDVVEKIEYLVALGINLLQPLPIDEMETSPSMGYNGADYCSPDTPYAVAASELSPYLVTINRLRTQRGKPAMAAADITAAPNQVRILIDLCHLYGIAVAFDVVYNHAGGFGNDDESLYFWDRRPAGNNNDSQYFTDQGWAGGLSFALWNADVRQFLIDTAVYYVDEFHVDGFRYDEISALCALNGSDGWPFAQALTSTLRYRKPEMLHNAEFWPVNEPIVEPAANGGGGFDVTQHDALRSAVRSAIGQSSYGAWAAVDMTAVAGALYPAGFPHAWQAVTCVENHDIVKLGTSPRIPALADGLDHRSWYARSRSRVATALLLTAPGLPHIFMGQEFLEDKQWSDNPANPNLIDWTALDAGDRAMSDHLRFTQDVVQLRRRQPALHSDWVSAFHVHDGNRVIAFWRLVPGIGRDVVVVASLSDSTYQNYRVGFPGGGTWLEIFNSDAYDNWVNPIVAGNSGAIQADGSWPMHGLAASASIVIPANGVVVFARDAGD